MEETKKKITKQDVIKGLKWFFFSFIWLAILMLAIDFMSKWLVASYMNLNDSIALIPNFLSVTYTLNDGMATGISIPNNPVGNAILFTTISVIGSIILIFATVKYWKKMNKVAIASLMLMISGTIGNLIDRAFYVAADGTHYVIDFIHFSFFPFIFNIADSCLVVGTIMLVITLIVMDVKQSKAKKQQELSATLQGVIENEKLNQIDKENAQEIERNQLENNVKNEQKNDDQKIKELDEEDHESNN